MSPNFMLKGAAVEFIQKAVVARLIPKAQGKMDGSKFIKTIWAAGHGQPIPTTMIRIRSLWNLIP